MSEQYQGYYGSGEETINRTINGKPVEVRWNWTAFQTTKGFPVDDNLLNWVIGQETAIQECSLCLDEWARKIIYLHETEWYKTWRDPNKAKSAAKSVISPGPYLLLLGDPGTGKSLLGKALSAKITEMYKVMNLKLSDVMCWQNLTLPSQPKTSMHDAGDGRKILQSANRKETQSKFLGRLGMKATQTALIVFGVVLLAIGFYFLFQAWQVWNVDALLLPGQTLQQSYNGDVVKYMMSNFVGLVPMTIVPGGSLIFFGVMIGWLSKALGGSGQKGIGGAKQSDCPKLIVDNSAEVAPFVDATGHRSSQLFGSVAWDPFQTGGLGTPEHQRVSAGDVHVASLGILFIDEIKNLDPEEAVTLLSVLEDGQLPITMRGRGNGGDTAAMSVSTEPVPAIDFLVAAGNFDSIGLIHPALMDRIYGYGKVVRMNNDMPNTEANRRRYVQFIAQEVKRFNLIPFSREACIEVTEEGRRRSGKNDALSVRFRGIISIIKTAATLAMNQKCDVVEVRHVKEALSQHCKTIQRQLLENKMAEQAKMLEIDPQGAKHGQIYGLAVVSEEQSQEMTGNVLNLKASMIKIKFKNGKSERRGSLTLTGGVNEKSMMADSSAKVRNVILQKYGVDIAQDYITHIDYSQSYGVDGPSAGVTMTILLSSLIEGKAIRQDVAVTGEINLSVDGKINITAVGGVHEKIKAAEAWGFKKVIIPQKNYEHSIVARDYRIEVLPAETLDDYLKICLVDKPKE